MRHGGASVSYTHLDVYKRQVKIEHAQGFVMINPDKPLELDVYKRQECILATQIIKDGEPSVWCQQNDRETLKPAPARAYELPSYCSAESAGIVRLLMELPAPDARCV